MVAPQRVAFAGGQVRVAPNDWEAQGKVTARSFTVGPFALDRTEVTHDAWSVCVRAGRCERPGGADTAEGALPVTFVTPLEAEAYCRHQGGRLPTSDEWLFAASGEQGRRYPWGQTGLVCRRAAFGLLSGPCASGALGPDLVGSRPDGATPEGLLDMAGNVAEVTRGSSGFESRGGSFRSQLAVDLKVWQVTALGDSLRRDSALGLRCAYDVPPPPIRVPATP